MRKMKGDIICDWILCVFAVSCAIALWSAVIVTM